MSKFARPSPCLAWLQHMYYNIRTREYITLFIIHTVNVYIYAAFPFHKVSDSQYDLGHILLNGVDFRCHGLTDYLCQERVEYAWLMQLTIGRIAGAFSTQQVSTVAVTYVTSRYSLLSLHSFCLL